MIKIISVVGARPQFIKAAMLSREIKKYRQLKELLIHTGQHYDCNMTDIFFEDLQIEKPDFFLHVGSETHGRQTACMLEKLEKIFIQERPNYLLVYGDTNSTLAAALAAAKLNIPIVHVESGLRSYNKKMPEEINRVITDHLSSLLFCPTQTAIDNAKKEGISSDKLFLVGDVMYDAARYYASKNSDKNSVLDSLKIEKKNYLLITLHRAENTDDPLKLQKLMSSFLKLVEKYIVVFPLHPRTRNALEKHGLMNKLPASFIVCEPVGYLAMSMLEKNARLIITDSGGVQKEAYFYRVPCITVRDETEWLELVDSGWNCLCPSQEFDFLAERVEEFIRKRGISEPCYGKGDAAAKIVEHLYNVAKTQ